MIPAPMSATSTVSSFTRRFYSPSLRDAGRDLVRAVRSDDGGELALLGRLASGALEALMQTRLTRSLLHVTRTAFAVERLRRRPRRLQGGRCRRPARDLLHLL